MRKYDALGKLLASRSTGLVRLTFEEVAGLVPGGLPSSAYRHRSWWGNDTRHVQAVAWMNAGWQVDYVDLANREVTFRRVGRA